MKILKKSLIFLFGSAFLLEVSGQNVPDRISILRAKAEENNPIACYELAKLAKENKLNKDDKALNNAEYQTFIEKAAKLGYAKAQYELAVSKLTSSNLTSQQQAYPMLQELVQKQPGRDFTRQNLLDAYYWMGHCLENAKGVRADMIRAKRYYLLAAIGNTQAKLAVMRFLFRDAEIAVKRSLERNPRLSAAELEKMYRKTGIFDILYDVYESDPAGTEASVEAFLYKHKLRDYFANYLEQKSMAGDPAATVFLAECLMQGKFFAQQRTRAIDCYRRAAEKQGSTKAAMYLAKLHEQELFTLKANPVIIKKYLLQAFMDPEYTQEAAAKLVEIVQAELDAAQKDSKTDKADITRLKEQLFYFMLQGHKYEDARKFIAQDPNLQYQAKDIILKAKEFRASISGKMTPQQAEQYQERLRIAGNAGYPLAVIELMEKESRDKKNYAALINAMLAFPWEDNAEWNKKMAILYLTGGKRNTLYSPEKAVEYLKKSADCGGIDALETLAKAYRNGNKILKIAKNPGLADQYEAKLVKEDVYLKKNFFFRKYLDKIRNTKDKSADDLALLFRSAGLNPHADYLYSQLLLDNDANFAVTGNVPFAELQKDCAMLILHLSARDDNYRTAINNIIQRIRNLNSKGQRSSDEVLLDQEIIKCYQAVL